MKNKLSIFKVFLLLALVLVACGDSSRDQLVAKSKLTFEELNLRQISDSIIESGTYAPRGSVQQSEAWQATMATYATAGVQVQQCVECEPGCVLKYPDNRRGANGSGFLTSYNRLATAFHVTKKHQNVRAIFGAPYLDPDKTALTEELDYLLALRMWSLGMIDFAVNSDTIHPTIRGLASDREALRVWSFSPSPGGDLYTSHGVDIQGLSSASPRALDYPGDSVQYTSYLYGPGILFGHFAPHAINTGLQGEISLSNQQELWGTQYNQVPTAWLVGRDTYLPDLSQAQFRSLLSRPGYSAENGIELSDVDDCASDSVCLWNGNGGEVHDMVASDCYKMSVDQRPGSSGGSVLLWSSEMGVQGSPDILRNIGVSQGGLQGDEWDPDVNTPYPNDDNRNVFSAIPADKVELLSNDFSDGLDLPDITFPEGGSGGEYYQPGEEIPEGCDQSAGPDCRDMILPAGDSFGADGRTDLVERRCQTALFPEVVYGQESEARVAQAFAVGLMGETSLPLPLGNNRYTDDTPERFLSTLEMVCAPWSAAQWSVHWQDLRFLGWERPNSIAAPVWSPDALQRLLSSPDHYIFGTNLSAFLPTAYEIYPQGNDQINYYFSNYDYVEAGSDLPETSEEVHDLLRPVSMQLCPPGHVMSGLDLIVRSCNDGTCFDAEASEYVRGIEGIECVKVPYDTSLPHEVQRVRVPTSPDVVKDLRIGNLYETEDFNYEFGGEIVKIEQQLGTPVFVFTNNYDRWVDIDCFNGEAVASMRSNPGSLQTTAIDLFECIPVPRVP